MKCKGHLIMYVVKLQKQYDKYRLILLMISWNYFLQFLLNTILYFNKHFRKIFITIGNKKHSSFLKCRTLFIQKKLRFPRSFHYTHSIQYVEFFVELNFMYSPLFSAQNNKNLLKSSHEVARFFLGEEESH